MNSKTIVFTVLIGAVFSQPVFAISEAYRAQLEQSGCTQVDDANGTCHPKQHAHSPQTAGHSHAMAKKLNAHVAGLSQGQAVDYMVSAGWRSLNEARTRWHKDALTVEFELATSGKVVGVMAR